MTDRITVDVQAVQSALRDWLCRFDYDLHKGTECSEDGGEDTYPAEAADLFACMKAAACPAVLPPLDGEPIQPTQPTQPAEFVFTDPYGTGLQVAPGHQVIALTTTWSYDSVRLDIPLDRVEEVVAGIRDMARQAAASTAEEAPQ